MSKIAQDHVIEHRRTIVLVINRAGDQISQRDYYSAMWTLWRLIPALDGATREKFDHYRDDVPNWEKKVRNIKGKNWVQDTIRRRGAFNSEVVPLVEQLYWDLYTTLVDNGYFETVRGMTLGELRDSKTVEE